MDTRLHLNSFLATGVGSLPHTSPGDACSLIFKYFKDDIPFWPQLPKKNFKENMYVQYSQGLPGVVIDEAAQKIYIDTRTDSYAQALEAAYEHYLAEDLDYFAISQDYAAGLYEFANRKIPACRQAGQIANRKFIKGQTIGPISFGLTVSDQNKQASIYNQEFCDCLVKVLAMKARWQIRKLQIANRKSQIIICIDEPYLVSIGSSFFNIKPQDVIAMLNELIDAIHKEGSYAALHCCGNTDWGLVLKTNIDILNFDAYNYMETLFIYPQELDNFIKRGGVLAFGIVPNGQEGRLPSATVLLEKMGKPKTFCLISPSCGLSGVTIERAEDIFALAALFSKTLSTV